MKTRTSTSHDIRPKKKTQSKGCARSHGPRQHHPRNEEQEQEQPSFLVGFLDTKRCGGPEPQALSSFLRKGSDQPYVTNATGKPLVACFTPQRHCERAWSPIDQLAKHRAHALPRSTLRCVTHTHSALDRERREHGNEGTSTSCAMKPR